MNMVFAEIEERATKVITEYAARGMSAHVWHVARLQAQLWLAWEMKKTVAAMTLKDEEYIHLAACNYRDKYGELLREIVREETHLQSVRELEKCLGKKCPDECLKQAEAHAPDCSPRQ